MDIINIFLIIIFNKLKDIDIYIKEIELVYNGKSEYHTSNYEFISIAQLLQYSLYLHIDLLST